MCGVNIYGVYVIQKIRYVWLDKTCTLSIFTCFPGELYVSDKCGSDQDGEGTEQKPFKTPLKVNDCVIYTVCM